MKPASLILADLSFLFGAYRGRARGDDFQSADVPLYGPLRFAGRMIFSEHRIRFSGSCSLKFRLAGLNGVCR